MLFTFHKVAPCDPWTRSVKMTSNEPATLRCTTPHTTDPLPEHNKRTSNTLHSEPSVPGMPQARASSIMMFLKPAPRCKDAATRLQGLQRGGSTGKRHLNWPSWQHGERKSRADSYSLFRINSASTQTLNHGTGTAQAPAIPYLYHIG